jgi:hypothetical protein
MCFLQDFVDRTVDDIASADFRPDACRAAVLHS